MLESLGDAEIRVVKLHIFAHQGNVDGDSGVAQAVHHMGPLGQIRLQVAQAEFLAHDGGEPLLLQHQRRLVQQTHIAVFNDAFPLDVAEQCDLVPQVGGKMLLAPADDDIGLNAQGQ